MFGELEIILNLNAVGFAFAACSNKEASTMNAIAVYIAFYVPWNSLDKYL